MKFSPYSDGERLYGNVTDEEIEGKPEAPLHAEWLDEAIEREIKKQKGEHNGNQNIKIKS